MGETHEARCHKNGTRSGMSEWKRWIETTWKRTLRSQSLSSLKAEITPSSDPTNAVLILRAPSRESKLPVLQGESGGGEGVMEGWGPGLGGRGKGVTK